MPRTRITVSLVLKHVLVIMNEEWELHAIAAEEVSLASGVSIDSPRRSERIKG